MMSYRTGGCLLIVGSVAGIIIMMFHPTGRDLFTPGRLESASRLFIGAHSLAMASLPVMFLGALVLSRRLGLGGPFALSALVIYAFGLVAALSAAVLGGLVAPDVAHQIVAAAPPADEPWRIAFHYTGDLNQAFAQVLVVASSVAILLWSVAIVRTGALVRGIGMYGLVAGPVTVAALLSGHLRLNVHGFGLVILIQSVWFVLVGAMLWRLKEPS